MKFKKLLIAGVAILGLSSISGISANASSYFSHDIDNAEDSSTKYVRRPLDLEQLSRGHVFANVHKIGNKWLYHGEAIKVTPFYHMGHDGFVVHIPGHHGIYYAPTNSYNWFSKYKHVPKSHNDWFGHGFYDRYSYSKTGFKRSNSKKLLKRAGYDFIKGDPEIPHDGDEIFNKYSPYSHKACVPKGLKIKKGTSWAFNSNTISHYVYKGHGLWKAIYYHK